MEGGTLENDFHDAQTRVGSSYLVVISSRGTEPASRECGGHVYELNYWGGAECEPDEK